MQAKSNQRALRVFREQSEHQNQSNTSQSLKYFVLFKKCRVCNKYGRKPLYYKDANILNFDTILPFKCHLLKYITFTKNKTVSDLPPGKLPDAGHSHGDGGVEVTPGHAPRHQDAQHHPNTPSAMTHRVTVTCLPHWSGPTHPQLMLKKSPLCPRDRVDWAMDPAPNRTRMKVPISSPRQSKRIGNLLTYR